ncbi:Fatty acid metabolism regulator protein [Corynebacterium occultum]|uniref:Fatty acid metabolism regulator protein n=1 Tax=Corynebacterium occultum TaxID=2675219 RepID=A0A6B8WHM3_9CORY|nr:TetR/AcrR family transcriptional regulator [Corynebacterium occultum]QGU06028.1 Fatty acid metabolism regulator protein [Corynebacterium occultum]
MVAKDLPMHQKRRELAEPTRKAILDAAARLMAERGFEGTTVAALEKESGFPASSIYWHFSSKEGVLAAVMERGAVQFLGGVEQRAWQAETAAEQVKRMFIQSGMELITDPEQAQFLQLQLRFRLNRQRHEGKAFYEVCDEVYRRGVEVMHRQIRAAYERHGAQMAENIADKTGALAVAMIDGIYLSRRNSPVEETEMLLEGAATSLALLADSFLPDREP